MKMLSGLAASMVASILMVGSAGAAPIPANAVFTTPDVAFASHGAAAQVRNNVFSLSISTILGDSIAIDNGSGFSGANGTLLLNSGSLLETSTTDRLIFGSGGTYSLIAGGQTLLLGSVDQLTLVRNDVGYTYLAGIDAAAGTLRSGFANGGGFFGHLFNVTGEGFSFSANAKGDVAALQGVTPPPPAIPEPATLALVSLGLGGLFASARRRMA